MTRVSGWYGHKLEGDYIGPNSSKQPDPYFVSGVIKIQDNNCAQMTVEEKDACQSLLAKDYEIGVAQAQQTTLADRMRDRIKKRKAGVMDQDLSSPYRNCDFICGSAAEVERLWSVAKKILTNNRYHLTVVMFETLMFLKMNEDYWDLQSVHAAHSMARKPKRTTEIEAMLTEEEGGVDLINV